MSETKMIKEDIEKLHNAYNSITKDGYIGGSSQLDEFSKKCREMGESHDDLKVPAYVISSIFKEMSNNQYDRRVDHDECENIYNTLNPALQGLFEDMKTGSDYQKSLKKVIEDFEKLF